MYIKTEDTKFAIGYMNDEYMLSFADDFNHSNNRKIKSIYVPTYFDELNSRYLYLYNNCLCTLNEVRVMILSKKYNVK